MSEGQIPINKKECEENNPNEVGNNQTDDNIKTNNSSNTETEQLNETQSNAVDNSPNSLTENEVGTPSSVIFS